jgi:hypothetical protein
VDTNAYTDAYLDHVYDRDLANCCPACGCPDQDGYCVDCVDIEDKDDIEDE